MERVEQNWATDGQRAEAFFSEQQQRIFVRTDRLFAALMMFQWLAGIVAALTISPLTWEGSINKPHIHVWAAVLLGGSIISLPILLAALRPGRTSTRHVIAAGQMLTSALLIHLSGGRIETHFHVFGSLAFLAFYRDWRVLITASAVIAVEHFVRGVYWPQSVYGVLVASPWRWIEHAGWVIFEDIFLIISTVQSKTEMHEIAERQARLEETNAIVEAKVVERTVELENKVDELAAAQREVELARQQAESANRLKSQFLANTSHELRTPLNGIMGYLKLVLDKRCDGLDEEREFIAGAYQSSKHLLSLINDVLDVAKIEAGKLQVDITRVSLADLFHDVAAISHVQAAEKGLTLEFEELAEDLEVRADAGRTKQVLINLVGNALKFTPRGGSIRVRAIPRPDEGHIWCEVSDTGPGIPKDKQIDVFQPFRQLDGSSTRQYGGAGLGLAIARRLVEMMGGFIWVESEPGSGARFIFSLPVFDESTPVFLRRQTDRRQGFERQGPPDAPLVLVVEDDVRFREYLCRLLDKEGFATIWAMTADDGLAALREFRPTAVCIDHGLPAIEGAKLVTGWDLLVAIEKDPELRDTGLIMVTGFDQELRRRLSVAGPNVDVDLESAFSAVPKLQKPIDPDDFIAAVRAVCRPADRRPGRILLADDDPTVARLVEKAVKHTGWQLTTVSNGRECVEYLVQHPNSQDLLVLDLMMPELDGFGVLRALRLGGVAPDLPVIVLTSYPEMCTTEICQLLELGTVVPILAKAELLSEPDRLLDLLGQPALELV